LPFLFLPDANLNPDFRKCTAFGEVSTLFPHVLVRAMHRQHVSFCSVNGVNTPYHRLILVHYTTPLATGHIWRSDTSNPY